MAEPEKIETASENLAEAIGREGTLAHLQSRVPKMRFDPESEALVEEEAAPAGEQPPEKEEKPEKKPPGKKKAEVKPGEEQPPEDKFKDKTKEEVISAHAEAERRMHEATTAEAEAKKAVKALETERDELKKSLEEHLSKPPEKPAEQPKPVVGEERKTRIRAATKAAMAKIGTLDRQDPDYQQQVEDAWSEALIEVSLSSTALTPEEVEKMVNKSLKAAKDAEDEARGAERKQAQAESDEQVRQTAADMAAQAGLDMTPGSLDFITFWYVAHKELLKQEFMKGEKPPLLKTQVDWVVTEVRKKTGAKVQQTQEELEKARKHQERNAILTPGTTRTPPREEPLTEPVSLAVLQREQIERQRARHKGA